MLHAMENIMNDTHARAPIPLEPVKVHIADPSDGLLKTADLNTPIPVEVKVWEAAEPGYFFQLVLDGHSVGTTRVITEADKPGDSITVLLPHQLLDTQGDYQLGYRASSPLADSHKLSPMIPLRVDRTPPGAALLAPIIFPTATFGERLVGRIPGYAGMEAGDTVHTLLNGTPGPSHIIQPAELSDQPLDIVFERDELDDLTDKPLTVEYRVSDRAGNVSRLSAGVMLDVKL